MIQSPPASPAASTILNDALNESQVSFQIQSHGAPAVCAGAAEFFTHFKSKRRQRVDARHRGGPPCVAFSFSARRDLLSPHPSIMSGVESTVSLSSHSFTYSRRILSVSRLELAQTKSERLKGLVSPLMSTDVCATARSCSLLLPLPLVLLHGRVDFNFFFFFFVAFLSAPIFPLLLCLSPAERKETQQTNKRQPAGNFFFLFLSLSLSPPSLLFVLCYTPIMSACSRLLLTRCNAFSFSFFFLLFYTGEYRMYCYFCFLFFSLSFFPSLRTCFCRTCQTTTCARLDSGPYQLCSTG